MVTPERAESALSLFQRGSCTGTGFDPGPRSRCRRPDAPLIGLAGRSNAVLLRGSSPSGGLRNWFQCHEGGLESTQGSMKLIVEASLCHASERVTGCQHAVGISTYDRHPLGVRLRLLLKSGPAASAAGPQSKGEAAREGGSGAAASITQGWPGKCSGTACSRSGIVPGGTLPTAARLRSCVALRRRLLSRAIPAFAVAVTAAR